MKAKGPQKPRRHPGKALVWRDFQIKLRTGEVGGARVEEATLTLADAELQAMQDPRRVIPPGRYFRLMLEGEVVMSDTPAEIQDLFPLFYEVRKFCKENGHGPQVLITGLGLGVAVQGAFLSGARKVTVIEKSEDVCLLVGTQWRQRYGPRLEVLAGDALQYDTAGLPAFDLAWHDIWSTICTDNLWEMGQLRRKYGGQAAWQGAWQESELLARKEREKIEARQILAWKRLHLALQQFKGKA